MSRLSDAVIKMHNIRRHSIIVFSLLVIASAVFFIWPSIDLHVSHQFFNTYSYAEGPLTTGQFFMRGPIFKLAQKLVDILFATTLIVSGCLVVFAWYKKKRHLLLGSAFIFLSFALGPGLLVNAILKNHWGRPRPYYTQGFIWHKPYVRVWEISNECDHNCSFVSGDSSTAFAFLAFAFLPFRKRRWKVLLAGLSVFYFALNGMLRIIHGAHYISDVVIGALLVYLVILGCYQVCYRSVKIQAMLLSR